MECHKCQWAAEIRRGGHAGVRFEDTPCARCSLDQYSGQTRDFEERRGQGPAVPAPGSGPMAAGGESDDVMPVSVLADAVRLLMSLPRDALEVLRLRYGGLPYREIAEILGRNIDAVEKRHLRVIAKHPALGELFPKKVRKQRARQRRGKRGKKPG